MTHIKTKSHCLLITLAVFVTLLASCVQVDVVDRQRSGDLAPDAPTAHNLTAGDITFEPSLDEIGRSALRQGVNLFVEVQNHGLQDETEITVQVTLETEGQDEPLAQQETQITDIAAGETTKAHFRLTELVDLHAHYTLTVAVQPCAGEIFVQDNQRTFDLYVKPVP